MPSQPLSLLFNFFKPLWCPGQEASPLRAFLPSAEPMWNVLAHVFIILLFELVFAGTGTLPEWGGSLYRRVRCLVNGN